MDFIMDKDKHEALLNELLGQELDHSRKTEILQELRTEHNNTYQGAKELTEKTAHLQKQHDDMVISNSQLFRKLGYDKEEEETEGKDKEYSETVTLEELEGGN